MVSLFHRLPLGGKLSLKATDEGRNIFLLKFFKQSGVSCFPFCDSYRILAFPFGESVCVSRR